MAMPTDELPDVSPNKKRKKNDGTEVVDAASKSSAIPDNVIEEPPTKEEDNQPAHSEPESGAELVQSAEVVAQEENINPPQSEEESAAALMYRDDSILELEDVQLSPSEPAIEAEAVQLDIDAAEEDTPPEHTESVYEEEFMTSDGQDPTVIAMQIGQDGGEKADVIDLLDDDSLLQQVAGVFLLWWHWAFFEITVTSPSLPIYNPPKLVQSEPISGSDDHEFVYDIYDWGYKLSTSKGEEMYSVGMSMCKMFYTIEKMIYILVKRIKDEGITTETEVQVTFDGHLLAQRKAFESIINLNYNVVVTNFDPGAWGERYLETVKRLSERGYGYPSEAPREIYKITKRSTRATKP